MFELISPFPEFLYYFVFCKILFSLFHINFRFTVCSSLSLSLFFLGVNFTNPLALSANALATRVWRNQFHKQNFTKLYQYSLLEITPNFYAVHSVPYASKSSVNLLTPKLLIKWWWNWPLVGTQQVNNQQIPNIVNGLKSFMVGEHTSWCYEANKQTLHNNMSLLYWIQIFSALPSLFFWSADKIVRQFLMPNRTVSWIFN